MKPRDIGTRHTTSVVRYLIANGFPHAELRNLAGQYDKGDITGTPGLVWECKGGNAAETAADGMVDKWMRETEKERRNANADIGVLVMKRRAIGPANAHQFWAVLPLWVLQPLADPQHAPVRMFLGDAVTLLRGLGYGESL